jgi:hypothetical protein
MLICHRARQNFFERTVVVTVEARGVAHFGQRLTKGGTPRTNTVYFEGISSEGDNADLIAGHYFRPTLVKIISVLFHDAPSSLAEFLVFDRILRQIGEPHDPNSIVRPGPSDEGVVERLEDLKDFAPVAGRKGGIDPERIAGRIEPKQTLAMFDLSLEHIIEGNRAHDNITFERAEDFN